MTQQQFVVQASISSITTRSGVVFSVGDPYPTPEKGPAPATLVQSIMLWPDPDVEQPDGGDEPSAGAERVTKTTWAFRIVSRGSSGDSQLAQKRLAVVTYIKPEDVVRRDWLWPADQLDAEIEAVLEEQKRRDDEAIANEGMLPGGQAQPDTSKAAQAPEQATPSGKDTTDVAQKPAD